MLVNAILGVHPFAGINDHYPNLEDMILHRLWIFDPKVAYPGNGDPKELLEGTELGIALKEIIVDETKKTLPINKLQEYQNSLVTCKCGKQHPRQLSYCPFCQTKPAVVPVSGDVQIFPLLNTISPLVFVAWQSGAVHAVTLGPNEYDYFRVSPRGQVDHQVLFERQKLPSRFAVVGDTHLAVQTSRTDINLYDLKTQSFVSATTSQAYAGNRQLVFRGTSQGLIRLAQGKLLIGTPFHDTLAESILPVDPLENQTYVWAAHDQDVQLVLVQYRQQQLYSLINSGVRYDLKVPQFSTGEALISASVVFAANSCLLVRLTEIGAKKYRRCSILSYDGQVIDVKSIDISQQSLPNIHSHGYSDSGNYYLWIPSDTGLLREDLLTLDRQTILHSRQHVTAADHVTCLGLRSSKYHFLIYNQQHIRYLIS
jgi:hypothetical protein